MLHMNGASVGAQSVDLGDRARVIDTLVIGSDARYGQRARDVLGDVGGVTLALSPPTDPADAQWLVQQSRAAVVVLDATGCEAAVGRVIAALSDSSPRLGVVVVCEHLTDAARSLGALPKWGWKRDLRSAVQRAQIDGSPLAPPSALWSAGRRDLRGVGRSFAPRR